MMVQELRYLRLMAPDVTLHYDKQAILQKLRPLCLDIAPGDGDEQITIWLENGYYMTWRPTAVSMDGEYGWATVISGAQARVDELLHTSDEAQRESWYASFGKHLAHMANFGTVMYRVWATLQHETRGEKLKVAPRVLQSQLPHMLLLDSLIWFQREVRVPLALRHTTFQGFPQEVSE